MQKKILIVDDDPVDVRLLKKILEQDYLVIEASDAWKAMAKVIEEYPDLVLADVMMPKRSGYTLCMLIKSNPNTKDIPVVMVTGLDAKLNKKIGKNMGSNGYLVKPIQPDKLHNIVSKLLTCQHQTAKC